MPFRLCHPLPSYSGIFLLLFNRFIIFGFLPPLPILIALLHLPHPSTGFPSSTEERLALPKADWVALAEGNTTALVAHAMELAKLADLVTLEKVERIEKMMNSSMQQNEQIMQKGNEALLERLTIAEEDQQEDYEDYGGRRSSRNGAKWSTLPMASWLTLALASSSLLLFRTFCPSYG